MDAMRIGVIGLWCGKIVKEKYPEAYFAYRTAFETTGLQLGFNFVG